MIGVAGAGAAVALGSVVTEDAAALHAQVTPPIAGTLGVDIHNHIDVPLTAGDVPGPDIDLAGEMTRSGLAAICMTFAVDYQPLTVPGQAYDRFLNGLTAMDAALAKNQMRRALTLADLEAAHAAGRPTVVQAVEGGHFIEGHVDRIEVAYRRGLRVLGLLHDHDADPPLGDIYTEPAHLGGLTPLGADVIRACNRLGIVIDLTHASGETVAAALKVATKPILYSHTGLNTQLGSDQNMARMMRSRLISKENAKVIADAGGVIGAWTHLAGSVDEYARNIRALVDVVGVEHVGIGTDTKLVRPRGTNSVRGRGPGGDRTNQAWPELSGGFYNSVVAALRKRGFTSDEVGRIGGGNFCRVFDAVTGGRT